MPPTLTLDPVCLLCRVVMGGLTIEANQTMYCIYNIAIQIKAFAVRSSPTDFPNIRRWKGNVQASAGISTSVHCQTKFII